VLSAPCERGLARAHDRLVGNASMTAALDRLEARVARDLATIEAPAAPWLSPRLGPDGARAYDVVIAGAGLSGLSIGFGLMRQGLSNILILDQRPGGREGPWITSARMMTLRSPKQLTGPDLGVASLAFRSWYEATAGEEAWERLDKISPRDWMDYLAWYRRVLALPVRNGARLVGMQGAGALLRLSIDAVGVAEAIHARRLVLATGVDGSGRPYVPALVNETLPRERYSHSADVIDPAFLADLDVGVLGAGASAFDFATTALANGARSVTLFARRRELPRTEALAWANFPGFLGSFSELDDLRRWRFMRRFFELQPPPTQEMFDRATAYANFRLVLGAPLSRVAMNAARIAVDVATLVRDSARSVTLRGKCDGGRAVDPSSSAKGARITYSPDPSGAAEHDMPSPRPSGSCPASRRGAAIQRARRMSPAATRARTAELETSNP